MIYSYVMWHHRGCYFLGVDARLALQVCPLLDLVDAFLPSARRRRRIISSNYFPPNGMVLAKASAEIKRVVAPELHLRDDQLLVASCDSSFSCFWHLQGNPS